jgi:hypothetical protein
VYMKEYQQKKTDPCPAIDFLDQRKKVGKE